MTSNVAKDGAVVVERFDISKRPDHGRPCVVEFRGEQGRLRLHCSRDDGSLWLFTEGPRGGSLGTVTLAVRRHAEVDAFVASPETMRLYGGETLWVRPRGERAEGARELIVAKSAMRARRFAMFFDDAAFAELLAALSEWAAAAGAGAR